jgi:hypothetical protein
MKPKLYIKTKILILYLGYNDMVNKTIHGTVPLKGLSNAMDGWGFIRQETDKSE